MNRKKFTFDKQLSKEGIRVEKAINMALNTLKESSTNAKTQKSARGQQVSISSNII